MLDPLTALGAVANVAQFVELAFKILTYSRSIYNSTSGSLVEYDDLGKVTEDVTVLTGRLRESITSTTTSSCLTEEEQALCDLCRGCVEVSNELTQALDTLKSQSKLGKLRSLQKALKNIWSKNDIDRLEKRVSCYKAELNVRIVVGLRTKIDFITVQQSDGFASLAEETKIVIQSLSCINVEVQKGFDRQSTEFTTLHSQTETIIQAHAEEDRKDHITISSQLGDLSQQADDQTGRVLDAQFVTKMALDLSIDQNLAEHNKTREEMNRLREEAERQVEVLTEEIRQLKIDLEASVKSIVASIGTASQKEAQKLKEVSNAKFNLWVAKELILEKLKAFLAMFRFNFAAEMWISATELSPWKLMPYPKFIEDGATESISTPYGTAKTCDSSMAYHHVDICYPIAARNVPMIKMCLDQGVDVNAPLPGAKISGTTPLMKAVATAYEYTPYDTIATMLLMRRDARKVVQLLLHHGADPDWKDDRGMSARDWSEYPLNPKFHSRPDWLIQQLLKHDPHPDFNHLLELTDAVWAGQIEKLESLLVKDSELLHLLEHHDVSPLGAAVYRRDEIMVNMLLDNGVSPGCLDSIGSSPLAIAVVTASEDMAHILMQRGADLNLTDPVLGVSPLEYAAREGMLDICRTLIRYPKNQSPLNVAELWNGEPGHQPNHQFSKPLALAVRRYHPDIVVLLLDHGADVFMDMRPFLQPGELPAEGIHAVTPRSFVERKIHTRHYNSEATPASRRILAILKQYEKRFRRKDSDEADVENLDDGWEAQREEGRSKRRYETTVAPSKPGFFGF